MTAIRKRRFSRQQRLRTADEFTAAMRQGRRSRNAHFAIYVLETSRGIARLGITVSRKVAPDAVTRNRIRRQIRESFRAHQTLPAGDIVVMAQSGAARASNSQLRGALEDCWQRITKS